MTLRHMELAALLAHPPFKRIGNAMKLTSYLTAARGGAQHLQSAAAKCLLGALVVSGFVTAASAQTAPIGTFTIELNRATDAASNCRLVFVARNGLDRPVEQLAYEVAIFDADSGVRDFLVLQFGRYPASKTRVVRFDVNAMPCADISRLLVNDVDTCGMEGIEPDACMDMLTTSSRVPIQFDK